MLQTIQDVQVPLLAVALLTAAGAKLAVRETPPNGESAGAGIDLRRNRPLAIGLVLAEGVLGVGLLTSTHIVVRLGTAMGFVGALWVVGELKARRPEVGCGCFGGLSTTRIGTRTIVRTALFVIISVIALTAPHTGLEVLRNALGWNGVLLLAELAVLAALSPEIAVALAKRQLRVPCELRPIPLSATYATLHASDAWREHRRLLVATEPVDVWRELCWRFLVYPGWRNGQEVEVVFAVSLEQRSRVVRAAVVERGDDDEDSNSGPNSGPNAAFAVPV